MATKRTSTTDPTVPMTTYLLDMKDGTKKKVVVPSAWRVTFGPLVPGSKNADYSHSGLYLRFYESGKEDQRAVFGDVVSFRDMSIKIQVEHVENKSEAAYVRTGDGNEQQVILEGQIRQWIDPDAPKPIPKGTVFKSGDAAKALKSLGTAKDA